MTIETRQDLIVRVAEFIAYDDRSEFYYNRDLMTAFGIGETEVQIANDYADEFRRYGRIVS